jgi:hypothetical protein
VARPAKARKTTTGRHSDIRKMKVMISSRCLDPFPRTGGKPLSEARRALKDRLMEAELFNQKLFDVWINEDAPPSPGDTGWDACMKQVDEADVILVLYNGNAGWSKTAGGVGICHGELKRALDASPGKVRLIRLGSDEDVKAPKGAVHDEFRAFVQRQDLFRGVANTVKELIDLGEQAVLHSFADLVGWGVREARKGKYYLGDALEWSRLDYRERQLRIRDVLNEALVAAGATHLTETVVSHRIESAQVLLVVDGAPAALSIPAAREVVGRPFLRDHELVTLLGKAIGPVHLIGCNRNATEAQALQLLGFPDATVVTAPFGVYVADDIQKIQFGLLSNCRDETTTRSALQRFLEWLELSGESSALVKRARSRKRIIEVIAKERA